MLMLMAKIGHFWRTLDKKVTVSKREVFLGMTTCTLAGMVVGMTMAPKKKNVIGSYNGNGAPLPLEEDEDEVKKDKKRKK